MSADIRHIVRQCAQGEGEFVDVSRLADEIRDKIPAAHVMGQIAEKLAPERVVSDVLNEAARCTHRHGPCSIVASWHLGTALAASAVFDPSRRYPQAAHASKESRPSTRESILLE